jgi:hypothetical protein
MREGLSQTVDIACMYNITICGTKYWDVRICKWEINGVEHYDTETQATKDCTKIGNGYVLWSALPSAISAYQTNDHTMLTKYIPQLYFE